MFAANVVRINVQWGAVVENGVVVQTTAGNTKGTLQEGKLAPNEDRRHRKEAHKLGTNQPASTHYE